MSFLKKHKYTIISICSVIAFIGLWELITDGLHVFSSIQLPSPVKVFLTMIKKINSRVPDDSTLIDNIFASLQVALTGFGLGAVIGVPLGILMAWFRPIDVIARPVFDMIRSIAPTAWIPIMLLLFGIGLTAKGAVIFVASFVPCVVNSYSGIKQTSQVHLWVGQTFGANNAELLFKVAIPTALPYIFVGLRLSLGTAWVSLVAAEMLASTKGLGYMITIGRMTGRTDIILVGMVVIGLLGALLSFVLTKLEKKVVKSRWGDDV